MINNCTLTGNIGADPEIFYNSDDNPVASFKITFQSSKKKTAWIKVVFSQRLAEIASIYVHKCAGIAVVGYPECT